MRVFVVNACNGISACRDSLKVARSPGLVTGERVHQAWSIIKTRLPGHDPGLSAPGGIYAGGAA